MAPLTLHPQDDKPVCTDLDAALEQLHARGEEWPNGFSSHGPMVAESLDHAGRSDDIAAWTGTYLLQLADPVPARESIDPVRWMERLGDGESMGDWIAHFDRELHGESWVEVVARWFPRLAPGVVTAATHGLLRSAHAVRGLVHVDNTVRRHELACGLGYWASRYETLPESQATGARIAGTLSISETLAAVPLVPTSRRAAWMISERVQQVDPRAFSDSVGRVAMPSEPQDGLRQVVEAGARLLIANPGEQITFIHSVTGPRSLAAVLPFLTETDQHEIVRHAFVAVAALWSSTGVRAPATSATSAAGAWAHQDVGVPSWDDLLTQAIATGDEHHIKLTVAAHDAVVDGGDEPLLRTAAASVVLPP